VNGPGPFETIDSAQEFMALLEQIIADTTATLQSQLPGSEGARSADGVRLAIYKLQQLREHVQKSRRILNDLNMIERVLISDHTLAT
jgi:hypothetical protein